MSATSSPPKETGSGWIGRSIPRKEDRRFLTGRGRYTDDLVPPGALHMAVLRSTYGHARIRGVDLTAAMKLPGVNAAATAADLAGKVRQLPILFVLPGMPIDSFPVLAADKVRYVGEPVAAVIAESRYVAEDALDLVAVDYEHLPGVSDALEGMAPDAPLLYEDWGKNVAYFRADQHGDAATAFAQADVMVREKVYFPRNHALPMETRACTAAYDPGTGQLTLWSSTQTAHHLRSVLARCLGFPEHRLRVICPDVGGAFGSKLHFYPEEVLVCWFSLQTGRTVHWAEDRLEHMKATTHAREQYITIELAARRDGTLLAVKADVVADCGAHPHSRGAGPSFITTATIPGPYKLNAYAVTLTGVVTNKTPFGAYRGYGKSQAVLAMERAMDSLASKLDIDPAELRLKNLVTPADMPYLSATGRGLLRDGDYPGALRRAMEMVDWEERRQVHRALRQADLKRGFGIATFVEVTGMPSSNLGKVGRMHSANESAVVRIEPDGTALVIAGYMPSGQSHETTFAQLAATELGLHPDSVAVILGDSLLCPYSGFGTGASRGAATAGPAVLLAAGRAAEQARVMAAHMWKILPDEVILAAGHAVARDGRRLSLGDVARAIYLAHDLPPGQEWGALEGRATFDVPETVFAFAAHIAEVEVDTETGVVRILDYAVVDDCGTVIHPEVVDGQIIGGVAQGVGSALLEELVYDENAQLLTGSLMDYLIPTACEAPHVRIAHHAVPSSLIPGGMKGVGEQGTVGAPAAVANAVAAALELGAGTQAGRLPLTPERVLALLDGAR